MRSCQDSMPAGYRPPETWPNNVRNFCSARPRSWPDPSPKRCPAWRARPAEPLLALAQFLLELPGVASQLLALPHRAPDGHHGSRVRRSRSHNPSRPPSRGLPRPVPRQSGPGEEDERNLRPLFPRNFQGRQPVETGHGKIGKNQVQLRLAQTRAEFVAARDAGDVARDAFGLQKGPDQGGVRVVVFGDAECATGDSCRFHELAPASRGRIAGGAARRRLIDHGPKKSKLLDGFDKLLEIHRLHHVSVHAQRVAPHQILLLARGSHHHHRNALELLVRLLRLLSTSRPSTFGIFRSSRHHHRQPRSPSAYCAAVEQINPEPRAASLQDHHFIGQVDELPGRPASVSMSFALSSTSRMRLKRCHHGCGDVDGLEV